MGKILQTSKKLTSLDEMFGGVTDEQNVKSVTKVDINNLIPFSKHPFKLYEGARLEDMVRSVKELGVLTPILVRKLDNGDYEILSGHNRWNAAKIVGLSEVPIHPLEDINDEEAMLIVTETNLIQRSFNDLLPSERACVLAQHHEALKSQGKRMDLLNEIKLLLSTDEMGAEETSGPLVQKLDSRERTAENYDLSGRTVTRYLRINELSDMLKEFVDTGTVSIRAAVEISYLNADNQSYLAGFLNSGKKLDMEKASKLHTLQKESKLDEFVMEKVLDGTYNPRKPKSTKSILNGFKIEPKLMKKYFKENQSEKEVKEILEEALELYFQSHQGGS